MRLFIAITENLTMMYLKLCFKRSNRPLEVSNLQSVVQILRSLGERSTECGLLFPEENNYKGLVLFPEENNYKSLVLFPEENKYKSLVLFPEENQPVWPSGKPLRW